MPIQPHELVLIADKTVISKLDIMSLVYMHEVTPSPYQPLSWS